MKVGYLLALCALALGLTQLSGCAVRCSVTPVQAEEFTQKTVTNQFFDWMFKKETK